MCSAHGCWESASKCIMHLSNNTMAYEKFHFFHSPNPAAVRDIQTTNWIFSRTFTFQFQPILLFSFFIFVLDLHKSKWRYIKFRSEVWKVKISVVTERVRLYGFSVSRFERLDSSHMMWCWRERKRESSIMYLRTLCWCSYGIWFDYVFKLGLRKWKYKEEDNGKEKSTCMKPNGIHSSFFSSHFTRLLVRLADWRVRATLPTSQTLASETTTPPTSSSTLYRFSLLSHWLP